MYEIATVVHNISHNPRVLVVTVIGWIGGSVQFLEGIRLGWRNKAIGLPLGYLCAVIAHDSAVASEFHTWFNTPGTHYFEIVWFFYPGWVCIEIATIAWFVHLAYKEFKPAVPEWAYYGIVLSFIGSGVVLFHLLDSVLQDPLHIFGLAISQIVNVVFMIPLILRRGTARTTSRVLAWSIAIGPGSFGLLQCPAMVPSLRTGLYYGMVGAMALLSAIYIVLVEYYRRLDAIGETTEDTGSRAAHAIPTETAPTETALR